jgi:predicted nucleic acid-binding protein
MIHLDTNLLIALADEGDLHREIALHLMETCTTAVAVSALAWWEFECGPITPEGLLLVRRLLLGGIVPFQESQAQEAARLFNAAGRARRLKFDSLIAATAILAGAELATANPDDFEPFVAHGLKLLPLL